MKTSNKIFYLFCILFCTVLFAAEDDEFEDDNPFGNMPNSTANPFVDRENENVPTPNKAPTPEVRTTPSMPPMPGGAGGFNVRGGNTPPTPLTTISPPY